MSSIKAYAAKWAGGPPEPFEFTPGPLGAVLEPLNIGVFPLLVGQRSISATPLGSPATTADMLEFSARHKIAPVVEEFPISKVNDALAHLDSGKARYRVVLKNDF